MRDLHALMKCVVMLCLVLFMSACQQIVVPESSELGVEEPTQSVPRFEPSECKYPILAEANAECGYLVVSEDRNNPESPTIRVYVIKFLSASETPAPDPVVVIPGGPGMSGDIHPLLWSVTPIGEVMRAERDVYILEARGAMYSEPAFYCPEMEAETAELAVMSLAEEAAWSEDAYRACHDRLLREGANLSHYGPLEIAHDVADLRTALGIDEINVYGSSFGTTPLMVLTWERPEGVRSVILDSIYPPDLVWVETVAENMTVAIDRIFETCAADPVCAAAFPELNAIFSDVLTTLQQDPAIVNVTDAAGQDPAVIVDDVKFAQFVYDSIFIGGGFTSLPASIYAASQGDLQAPAEGWIEFISGRHGPVSAADGSQAKGMKYSASCLQDGKMTDLATATAVSGEVDTWPSIRSWGVTHMLSDWLAPCAYWDVTSPTPNVIAEPVESDIATLMLTGIFDPDASQPNSQQAAERLSNSYYYEMPSGHILTLTECGRDLIGQFLANPTQAPDASCIDEMTPNWVLPE